MAGLSQMVLAGVLAQLLVLWFLGDARLRAAVGGLFRKETFAAGEDTQPDWGADAWAATRRPVWAPAAADAAGSRDPPGAGGSTSRDYEQAPAAWALAPRPPPPPRTQALGGWESAAAFADL
jgi:hypothetical protein